MKFLNSERALCLSPHPDDVEYAMAGTVLKCDETEFHILIMSEGGTWDESTERNRIREVENFWNIRTNVMLRDPGTSFIGMQEDRAVLNLEENTAITFTHYDTLLIPTSEDTHFFHRAINSIGQALCRVRPLNLIEYAAPSVKPTWVPNLIVDIAAQYEEKKRRLKAFGSQQHHSYFQDFCLDAYHSDLHTSKKGLGWVERFRVLNAYQ